MVVYATTLGHNWIDHYLYGMILLHSILGLDVNIVPKVNPTPASFVAILQDIVTGNYKPSKYFNNGKTPQLTLVDQPPCLKADQQYLLINLNANTTRSQFVSVFEGGILYEDPVWAILAAHAMANKISAALPLAKDNHELWNNKSSLTQAVKEGKYKPQNYLGAISGFIPTESSAKFELVSLESDNINSLRDRGMQSVVIGDNLRFVELFQQPQISNEKKKK